MRRNHDAVTSLGVVRPTLTACPTTTRLCSVGRVFGIVIMRPASAKSVEPISERAHGGDLSHEAAFGLLWECVEGHPCANG
jgi:hypothetical protein